MSSKVSTRKGPGRPSSFTPDIGDAICERLANGESLRRICDDKRMPARSTILRWLASNDHREFHDQYARARDAYADVKFDEILHIADTPLLGKKTVTKADGGKEIIEGDMIEHRRLQIDARKWVLARLAPKKYGDLSKLEVGGSVGITMSDLVHEVHRRREERKLAAPPRLEGPE